MINKNVEFKWSLEGKEAFEKIKTAISNAPVLCSPNFNKYFFFYTCASDLSIVVLLNQKNAKDEEHPISFMSTNLHETQLKYLVIDKQAYVFLGL